VYTPRHSAKLKLWIYWIDVLFAQMFIKEEIIASRTYNIYSPRGMQAARVKPMCKTYVGLMSYRRLYSNSII